MLVRVDSGEADGDPEEDSIERFFFFALVAFRDVMEDESCSGSLEEWEASDDLHRINQFLSNIHARSILTWVEICWV